MSAWHMAWNEIKLPGIMLNLKAKTSGDSVQKLSNTFIYNVGVLSKTHIHSLYFFFFLYIENSSLYFPKFHVDVHLYLGGLNTFIQIFNNCTVQINSESISICVVGRNQWCTGRCSHQHERLTVASLHNTDLSAFMLVAWNLICGSNYTRSINCYMYTGLAFLSFLFVSSENLKTMCKILIVNNLHAHLGF